MRVLLLYLLSLSWAAAQSLVGQVTTRDVHALLWLKDGRILFGHHDGIQVSEDEGRSWRDLVRRAGFDAMSLVRDGDRLLAAGHWVLAESRNGGRTWRNLRPKGLPAMDLHGYAVLPGGVHFALEANFGYFRSQDGGKTFSPLSPKGLPKAGMAAMASWGQALYVAPMGQGLYRSEDGGLSFERLSTPEREVYVLAVFGPSGQSNAAGAGGLFLGGKGGLWQRTPTGWRRLWQGPVLAIAVHPSREGRLVWIDGMGRVWRMGP